MSGKIELVSRDHPEADLSPTEPFGLRNAQEARRFHQSFPEYGATPLRRLNALAAYVGVQQIYVKDESLRFGLNAFKALGGSYAVGNIAAKLLKTDMKELDYSFLSSPGVKEKLGSLTFVTATDGNPGRGGAWAASRLHQRSVVYMPAGSAIERLKNIRDAGAEAEITDLNYDDTVRMAHSLAEQNGWILVQDTAWEGYEEIPRWIMQGYTTMALEASEQLDQEKPTHIFIQAGVGAMAGAVTGFFSDLYGDKERPKIVIVEPNRADCLYKTAKADDGTIHAVTGALDSIMAGLCCGEPCTIGWEILRDHADYFVSCPDFIAANGMRILGNPLPGDERIISGESGAVTTGLATEIMTNPEYAGIRNTLGLNQDSRILCFNTEGDTDKAGYRRIVWEGAYHSPVI